MAKHRSLTNVENHGYVILKSLTDFPQENPDLGSLCRINGIAYIYDSIQGFETWYPLTNRYSTYVHNQGAASALWTVNHNLGTQNVIVQIYDGGGVLSIASPSEMTDNSFKVSFTAPITGKCIVFAAIDQFIPKVQTNPFEVYGDILPKTNLNTKIGTTDLRIDKLYIKDIDLSGTITGLTNIDLSGYYTKTETDNRIQQVVGAAPAATREEITATVSNQTAFTLSKSNYTGVMLVFVDGLLESTSRYTYATNQLTLSSGVGIGVIVTVVYL